MSPEDLRSAIDTGKGSSKVLAALIDEIVRTQKCLSDPDGFGFACGDCIRCKAYLALELRKEPGRGGPGLLTDDDPMPWGQHGGTLMAEVPAAYMFWLWTVQGFETDNLNAVACYIRANLTAFEQEHPDGIWRTK